jgi:hypothetical protein
MGMAKHKAASVSGPLALVGSVSGRAHHKKKKSGRGSLGPAVTRGVGALTGTARAVPQQIEKVVAGPLRKPLVKRLPSRRRRRKLAKRLRRDMDRLSGLAGRVSTALGVAAAAAEVVSAVRGQAHEGNPRAGRHDADDDEEYGGPEDAEGSGDAGDFEGAEDEDFEDAEDYEDYEDYEDSDERASSR